MKRLFLAIKNAFFGDFKTAGSTPAVILKGMENDLPEGAETGVIIIPPKPTAWVAGAETGIEPVVLEEDGQYDAYLPDEENQSFYNPKKFDTQSCVTFSATNDIETLINRQRALGLLSQRVEDFLVQEGYIDPGTNKVNFSDRFTAKMSGTRKTGNNLEAVGDSIRNHGLVPEKDWPMPNWNSLEGKTQDELWEVYMAEIPQWVKDKALRFKEFIKVNYQWVALGSSTPDSLREQLKYGPYQIAAKVCPKWSSNEGMKPIMGCGCGHGHATMLYGFKEKDGTKPFKCFDHYRSFRKLLDEGYCIPWAVQYSVKEATPSTVIPLTYTFRIQLKYGMPSTAEVNTLQKALQTIKDKDGKPYMTPGVYGPYGPQTKTALGRFQSDRGITDPDGQGTNFGPQTRSAMNDALKAINN